MSSYRYERSVYSAGLGGAITPAVKGLVIANVSVFALEFLIQLAGWSGFDTTFRNAFGLYPYLVYRRFYVWQLVTYLFLHGDVGHILVNMLMLWMFGCELEKAWGPNRFLRYYFLTGIGAGILTCFFSQLSLTI